MVMSLVLSVPVMTGQAMAAADPAEKANSVTQRTAAPRKGGKGSVGRADASKTETMNKTETMKTASSRPNEWRPAPPRTTSRTRIVHPASTAHGRTIYRTAGHDSAVIDDGTLWRESGSLVTWQQTGVASWYGGARWQGHRTTSGARYDQNELTAAHATLPIGTRVRVTLNDNASRYVIVTINDRPGTRSRIIDLSRQAAAELGILQRGVAMVTLTPL
jgi:rare lipoprotein A (peptidoglycan hydrolase)